MVFIKEIIPKPAITFVANTIYKENYQTLPMKHLWKEENNRLLVAYHWKTGLKWNAISIESEVEALPIEQNTQIEFIAEHYWGYAKDTNKTTEYEVKHPTWKYYPVNNFSLDIDFLETYGKEFEFLQNNQPSSVFLLEGSDISVENKIVL